MATRRVPPPKAEPETFSLSAAQLTAAAEFLTKLTDTAVMNGVYPDSGFVVELPAGLDEVQGPRVRVAYEGETELEYVITGLASIEGGAA